MCGNIDPQLCDSLGRKNEIWTFRGNEFLKLLTKKGLQAYPITHSVLLGSSSLLEFGDHIPIARMEELRFGNLDSLENRVFSKYLQRSPGSVMTFGVLN